ncbi:MAG: multifunctional CCA tRNA nucleotidyl transferase/2'3'-cyclic phosphodiesterase/2'nucleotidase/phosphatase [Candidatus Sedimenticola sp. 6PFRAG7]
MKVYKVGGAVRDRLLDLPVKDVDWVVVAGTEEEMLTQGYKRADADFPVFLHPDTGEEYALARRETKTGPGYKGFETYAGPDVPLEEDLQRRDLTINAIAEDEQGVLVDPFQGQQDLNDGMLRHITPAFTEDPVRLLRVARFAARLGKWGFRVAHGTHALMKTMAASADLKALKPERVWQEMKLALVTDQPWRFFEVLHRCGALEVTMPNLAASMGDPGAHAGEGDSEPVSALKRASLISRDPRVRFASIMFQSVRADADALSGMRAEKDYLELVTLAVDLAPSFTAPLSGDGAGVVHFLHRSRAQQQGERFESLLSLLSSLFPRDAARICPLYRKSLKAASAISVQALKAQGIEGAQLGQALAFEQLKAVNGVLSG